MNNLTILQQFFARWKAKSPTVFKVISTIGFITAFITGLPELIEYLGIPLPDAATILVNKVIAVAALVGGIIAKITVATPETTNKVITEIDKGTDKNLAITKAETAIKRAEK